MNDPSDIARRIAGGTIVAFPGSAAVAAAAPAAAGDDVAGGSSEAPAPDAPAQSRRTGGGGRGSSRDNGADAIRDLNDQFALVLMGSKAVVLREQPHAESIEDRVKILSVEAFGQYMANRFVTVETGVVNKQSGDIETKSRSVSLAAWWMKSRDRRTYDGVRFHPDPAISAATANDDESPAASHYFNLWRGFDVTPDGATPAADRRRKYNTFYDHLLNNICTGNQAWCDWFFAWFAHMIQRPRERIGTAVVVRGGEGVGKTKIGEVIGSLFKSHYFLVDDARYLTGNFNAHMASCLLLQVDEGFWAGDKGAEGRLKGLITARVQMIESKGVDPIRLDNYVRVMFSSNEGWVVPVGIDGRRYAVFDVGSNVQRNYDYFREMEAELDNGGREALLADLLDYDLDAPGAPNIRDIPKTGALLEQKVRSFDPVTAWWHGRLADGAPTHRMRGWPARGIAPVATLYNDYVRTAERIGVKRKSSETEFGMAMHKLVPGLAKVRRDAEVEQIGADGRVETLVKRVWCYLLPALDECREAIETAMGQTVNWPVDESETEEGGPEARESGSDDDF